MNNYFTLVLLVALAAYAMYNLLGAFLAPWYAATFLLLAFLGLMAAGIFRAILPGVPLTLQMLPIAVRIILAPSCHRVLGLPLPAGRIVLNVASVSLISLVCGGLFGCIAWLCALMAAPRLKARPGITAGDRTVDSSGEQQLIATESDQRLQQSGVYIGAVSGNPVILPARETVCHTFLIGSTGSGKTTCALNFIESCAVRNCDRQLKSDPLDL